MVRPTLTWCVGKIQELHYRITVALNSDARSEIEGLRWLLTRRAVFAIAISALMILATLRYSSYMTHTQEMDRKQMMSKAAQTDEPDASGAHDRTADAEKSQSRSDSSAAAQVALPLAGESGGYVSLG